MPECDHYMNFKTEQCDINAGVKGDCWCVMSDVSNYRFFLNLIVIYLYYLFKLLKSGLVRTKKMKGPINCDGKIEIKCNNKIVNY